MLATSRLRLRVRAAFLAARERAEAGRRRAAVRACRARASWLAARCGSRRSVRSMARERVLEGLRVPRRPAAESRRALRRVRADVVPFFGGGSFTPARRALDSPMAIACLAERAPCLPSRTCSISSWTNSPAWVEEIFLRACRGARPSEFSCSASFLLGDRRRKILASQRVAALAGVHRSVHPNLHRLLLERRFGMRKVLTLTVASLVLAAAFAAAGTDKAVSHAKAAHGTVQALDATGKTFVLRMGSKEMKVTYNDAAPAVFLEDQSGPGKTARKIDPPRPAPPLPRDRRERRRPARRSQDRGPSLGIRVAGRLEASASEALAPGAGARFLHTGPRYGDLASGASFGNRIRRGAERPG